jgi:hypothetical protein
LSVPAPDGSPFLTTVWSVPKAQIKFYAVGRREPPPAPPAPPAAEASPEAGVKLATEMPDFVREAGEALARDRGEAPPEMPKHRGGRKKKPAPLLPEGEATETSA